MTEAQRPLPIRMRSDLIAERLLLGAEVSWVVKDPLALRYYRLQDEEFAVLSLLDGRRTAADVCESFEKAFPPQRMRPDSVMRFLGQLHQQGLVVSDAAGQGEQLVKRHKQQRWRELRQRWSNPLTVRFRGIDPQRFLDAAYPWVRRLFDRRVVAASMLLMLTALLLVAMRWNKFLAMLPTHDQFFTPANFLFLMAALGIVKVFHEFGHGFACRHFGGRCHELGVMLLVLTPCLYCNVTDAWRFPDKRQRMIVSAAGMYVELVLAALAVIGWWFSAPGLLHHLCLSVMFVCSVNTLLFNGNPLLRYDGYYILADWVDVPNLSAKASSVFRAALERLVCKPPEVEDPLLPQHRWFWYCLYHAASTVYRIVLTFSIVLFLLHLAQPYRLENLVRALALATVVSLVVGPLKRGYQWVQRRRGGQDVRRDRAARALGFAVAALLIFCFLPLPKRVWGTLEIQPRDAQHVYVEVPGRLVEQTLRPGASVRRGDVVARLTDEDLQLQIVDLRARCTELQTRIEASERERFVDPRSALRLPELRESLAAAEKYLAQKLQDAERLVLKAERDGTIFPTAGAKSPNRVWTADQLDTWQGRVHDRDNVGCRLDVGTLYCTIGDARYWEGHVVVDQDDLMSLRPGLPVEVVFDQMPDVVFRGMVREVAQRELSEAPRHLSSKQGGEIATETDAAGNEIPLVKSYQVSVSLDDPEGLLRLGVRGSAKIRANWEPAGSRVLRWCRRTFHFDL